jgi:hypothetical protein
MSLSFIAGVVTGIMLGIIVNGIRGFLEARRNDREWREEVGRHQLRTDIGYGSAILNPDAKIKVLGENSKEVP